MTKAQRQVLERVVKEKMSVSSFDVPDPELCKRVQEAVDRWADTWVRVPIRDVLRVGDGELSSRDLLYYHPMV